MGENQNHFKFEAVRCVSHPYAGLCAAIVGQPFLPQFNIGICLVYLTVADLRGVEVVDRTNVIVTNAAQSFYWPGYGFKLYIPKNSLPAGVNQCTLLVTASSGGQYQLPDNMKLVSAIFWVSPKPICKFQQPLTVEIQHCAKMANTTKLAFVRAVCSQENLPYTFKELDGHNSFSEHSSYGCLEVTHFSGIGISIEDDGDRVYIASLYYCKRDPRNIEIHFAITWDNDCHITVSFVYTLQAYKHNSFFSSLDHSFFT